MEQNYWRYAMKAKKWTIAALTVTVAGVVATFVAKSLAKKRSAY
jgi:hypothetical protein